MTAMVRISSHVHLSHCPNFGRVCIEYISWWPFAAVVLTAGCAVGCVLRVKNFMFAGREVPEQFAIALGEMELLRDANDRQ